MIGQRRGAPIASGRRILVFGHADVVPRARSASWAAWGRWALTALAAVALIALGNLLVAAFPVRVGIVVNGANAVIAVGGETRTVTLDRPIVGLRLAPGAATGREYQIDGSDSTNTGTYDAAYFAAFSGSPYYRFQSWLRDEGGYSTWADLVVRDGAGQVVLRRDRPATGDLGPVPPAFDLAVALRRLEAPRAIDLLQDDGGVVRVEVDRNDKITRVLQLAPDGARTVLAFSYFPRDWWPELIAVLALALRACAVALLLIVALAPLASVLPARLPAVSPRFVSPLVPLTAAAAALAGGLFMGLAVFGGKLALPDSKSYYFQAQTFASGLLAAPAPPVPDAFPVPFTLIYQGQWFSMYTPGAALALAPGFAIGAPWLMGPLLAAAATLLTCGVARRQFGRNTAMLAAVLMACSPFLHLQAGTYLSHVPGMFWGAVLLYAATRYDEQRSRGWALLGAAALGCLFFTREMSAILYGLTLGGAIAWRQLRRDRRALLGDAALVGLCLGCFALAYLSYNQALTGAGRLLPRTMFGAAENRYGFGEGVGFYSRHTLGSGLVNLDEMLTSLTITLSGWPFAFSLALLALPFLTGRARRWELVHGAIAASFMVAYVGLYYHGIAYGPRYYFDALPSLIILSSRGFVALAGSVAAACARFGRTLAWPRARLAALLLCLALLTCNALYFWPQQVRLYRLAPTAAAASGLTFADVIREHPPGRTAGATPTLIVIRDARMTETFAPLNCPRLDCDTIFAYSPDAATDERLRIAFPGRTWYQLDGDGNTYHLER